MSRIIARPEPEVVIIHEHAFDWEGETGWGFVFSFPAGETPDTRHLPGIALENYRACLTGVVHGVRVVDRGIRERKQVIHHPTLIRCDCGEVVFAHRGAWMDTHTCDRCGRLYNSSGQALRPVEEWGEETGESASDLMTGYDDEAAGGSW